jgi:type I restriction enzyme S subunit
VDPGAEYRIAGVYSFGRGMLERPCIVGSETKYKRLFKINENDFVLSRLKAFEGAIAVAGKYMSGAYVSAEFPTFTVNSNKCDIAYLRHLCAWPKFWRNLAGESRGLGSRRERVTVDRLLATSVPLPQSIGEQRRIAHLLDSIKMAVDGMSKLRRRQISEVHAAIENWVMQGYFGGWRKAPLGSVAEINPKPHVLQPGQHALFVPMAAIDEKRGIVKPSVRTMTVTEIRNGFKQFVEGDVIFARITPCMQNGKSAVVRLPANVNFGLGSTELHVIRPSEHVSTEWLHRWVRMVHFRNEAKASFTGTAGQQRVPADFLRRTEIPVAPDADTEKRVLQVLEDLTKKVRQIAVYQERMVEQSGSLWLSALDAAFNGQM